MPDPAFSTSRNASVAPISSLLLTYHEVIASPSRDLYTVHVERFRQQMDFLSGAASTGTLQEGTIHISFDDGHCSNVGVASPVLDACRLKAVFFITAAWTGKKPDSMGWSDLRTLIKAGHSIQSHGWSHKFLTHCSPSELTNELRASKDTLENRLNSPVDCISLPGGRWNKAVLDACAAAGYRHVYTSDPLLHPVRHQDLWMHGRMMVHRGTSNSELYHFLSGDRAFWMKMRGARRLKQAGRKVLGDTLYSLLWRKLSFRDTSHFTPGQDGDDTNLARGQ
jgi:peptidoglycan/xylan/chitin deacetylase (PgdA/CDA1 family)